jgi:hypothetical protein
LASHSPEGELTRCFLVEAACWEMDRDHVFVGTLRDAVAHYDEEPERRGAPSNIWPEDRSWFVYSNYDLWGTKVSGSERLIASLEADHHLETVQLTR